VKVVVCVKQIPDPASPVKFASGQHILARDEDLVLDDADSYGVETGLQLAEAVGGGEVTVVSMAPRGEISGIRTALAMGADRAILVSDDVLAGSDALGTARVLAAAIRRAEPDLIIAGTDSTDGYTGTLPVQVAEILGLPTVSFAKRVSVADGRLTAHRQTEAGYDEVTVPLPALITVTAGVVEPRYPSFKGIMAARKRPVERLTVADLGIDQKTVGTAGARQETVSVVKTAARKAGEVIVDEGDSHDKILAFLQAIKVI
jgi:electron transfer flavoprotein beta subunit